MSDSDLTDLAAFHADAEPRETVVTEQTILKESIQDALESLVDLINTWNDVAADGDRGRANDAIALILYDDGSGKVCTYWPGFDGQGEHLNTQMEGDTIEEIVERLIEWM